MTSPHLWEGEGKREGNGKRAGICGGRWQMRLQLGADVRKFDRNIPEFVSLKEQAAEGTGKTWK